MKSKYRFQWKFAQFVSILIMCILLNSQNSVAQFCTNYTVYALDEKGYIYPVNTTTGVLQTPLNNSGVAPSTSTPNAIGYSGSKFYYISNTSLYNSPFISYDGMSTYNTGLSTAFINVTYPVRGTGTSSGLGFYAIDQRGYLFYYQISTDTWTLVTKRILAPDGTNLTTLMKNSVGNGDIAEDGNGSLWIVMASTSNYGLYKIDFPPTIVTTQITATPIIPYTTSLPGSVPSGETFSGIAFDASGTMYLSTTTRLYSLANTSSPPVLVATFSGLKNSGSRITDLTQCEYVLNVLPISWAYFKATLTNGSVGIDWGVNQGSSISGFYIERSNDSKNWERLQFVSYISGNSNYAFTDVNPLNGINYYRIAEVDFDNHTSYSGIRSVNVGPLSSITIWPNPVVDAVNVRYNGVAKNATATIFDQVGRSVTTVTVHQGNNVIDINNVAPGVYILVLNEGDNKTFYQKIIKRND